MAHDGKIDVVAWLDDLTANMGPEAKAAVAAFTADSYLGAVVRDAVGISFAVGDEPQAVIERLRAYAARQDSTTVANILEAIAAALEEEK